MWAFGGFAAVQLRNVVVDMSSPSFSVQELTYPCGGGKRWILQTERTVSRAGKGSAVDERIALDGERFRPSQVVLTVVVPLGLAENPLIAAEAQLGKAASRQECLFVAAVDVPPSLRRRFAVDTDLVQLLP